MRTITNLILKVYAVISFMAIIPQESYTIKVMIIVMSLAILNFTILVPFLFKRFYKGEY